MKAKSVLSVFIFLFLFSCSNETSLQKYFVEKTENKNFITFDISPSVLNIDQSKLSKEQVSALASFDKMNVLAFKLNPSNAKEFDVERTKVTSILKDEQYQQLIKIGSGKEGASVSFVGEDEHISEFVFFANKKENGFAIVRILGKDMNPSAVMNMITALQNSEINLEQLKPLQELLRK